MKRGVIKEVKLEADSPRRAFYVLRLEKISGGYLVSKESGGNGRVFHRQAWFRQSFDEADRFFLRIVKQKTDPGRKSERKYRLVKCQEFQSQESECLKDQAIAEAFSSE